MKKYARCLLVVLLLFGLLSAAFAGGKQEKSAEGTGKLVLATNNAPEGKSMAKALQEFGKLKGIKVEVVEAPYSNLFEKIVLEEPERVCLQRATPFFRGGPTEDKDPGSLMVCVPPTAVVDADRGPEEK